MKLVRSYPPMGTFNEYSGRGWVVDSLDPFPIENYDYRPLFDYYKDDDLIILEWDIAVSKEDLEVFVKACKQAPWSLFVAPYTIYDPVEGDHYCQFNYHNGERIPVEYGELACEASGFGMIYIPNDLIHKALYRMTEINDGMFSDFARGLFSKPFNILWQCSPIHLHYDPREALD